jgi:NAD(P)H-nitrite reductase large subunit
MGYKVVAGGHGARHPVIAETIAEQTDLDGVIRILERSIQLIKEKVRKPMRVFSLYRVMQTYGSEHLKK